MHLGECEVFSLLVAKLVLLSPCPLPGLARALENINEMDHGGVQEMLKCVETLLCI